MEGYDKIYSSKLVFKRFATKQPTLKMLLQGHLGGPVG